MTQVSNFSELKQKPLLLVSSRPWNEGLDERISQRLNRKVEMVTSPCQLNYETIARINPQWIFVPHWNHWIPESIWTEWPTVIFHMTDLPYGRGGSPLQNLIQWGEDSTVVSALRCNAGLDTGDIYLKQPLSLLGSAEEIYLRADEVIEVMIEHIVREEPIPKPQEGAPVIFNRRTPDQSNLGTCPAGDIPSWHNHIRMLDAEGYPYAFLDANGMRLEFRRVTKRSDGLHADVRIAPISLHKSLKPGSQS